MIDDELSSIIDSGPVRKDHSFPAVYRLTHVTTGKVYVGSSKNLYNRIAHHRDELINGNHRNKQLQKTFDTDCTFEISYLRTKSVEEALDIEQKLLDSLAKSDKLLNIASNARASGLGVRRSEDTKELLREANRSQFKDSEARQKHADIQKRLWQDPEYRARQSGTPRDKEACSNISQGLAEKWKDPEFRQTMSRVRSKPCIYEGVNYPSIKAAAEALGIAKSTLHDRLNRLTPTLKE